MASGMDKQNAFQNAFQNAGQLQSFSYTNTEVGNQTSTFLVLILAFVLDKTMGLRVEKEDEIMGLDQTQHSESGYNM